MKRWVGAAAAILLASTGAGCGSDGSGNGASGSEETTLTVYAAASLTSSFEKIGKQFEADHEGVTVKFSFAGSSDLVAQIQEGAPADVFASADTNNMDKATADDLVEGEPVEFATNTLEIAVPPDNPAGVASLKDLAKPGTKVVVCAAEVPCGAAAQGVEEAAGVEIKPVSEEHRSPTYSTRSRPARPTPASSTSPTSEAPAARSGASRLTRPAGPSTPIPSPQ